MRWEIQTSEEDITSRKCESRLDNFHIKDLLYRGFFGQRLPRRKFTNFNPSGGGEWMQKSFLYPEKNRGPLRLETCCRINVKRKIRKYPQKSKSCTRNLEFGE